MPPCAYFNVAGAAEGLRRHSRRIAPAETHLIPLILDVALGRRASIRIYGDDYPTPDEPAFATTFTSRIWPTRTCWRWPRWPAEAVQRPPRLQLGNGQGSVCETLWSRRVALRTPHSGGDSSAAAGRPSGAGSKLRKGRARAGMEAPIYESRRHHSHRVDLASEALSRVEGRLLYQLGAPVPRIWGPGIAQILATPSRAFQEIGG